MSKGGSEGQKQAKVRNALLQSTGKPVVLMSIDPYRWMDRKMKMEFAE